MIARRLGRLDVQIVPGAPTRVTMVGRIDDTTALAELLGVIPDGYVAIDTGGVTFINSIGLREWMRLVNSLRERGGAVMLERVADVLMVQLNMLPGFASGVHITSFHAPYACPQCGAEHAPLLDAAAHADTLRQLKAPRLPCPECGAAMELADFPERYLQIFHG